jgi:hypothetical protein
VRKQILFDHNVSEKRKKNVFVLVKLPYNCATPSSVSTLVLCGKYHHCGISSWDHTEARNLIVFYYIIGGS